MIGKSLWSSFLSPSSFFFAHFLKRTILGCTQSILARFDAAMACNIEFDVLFV